MKQRLLTTGLSVLYCVACVVPTTAMSLKAAVSSRPHGTPSADHFKTLFTALEHYAQTFHEDCTISTLWHPRAARKYVDTQSEELVVVAPGLDHGLGPARDLAVLSVDFLSPSVCAAKVQLFTDSPLPRRITVLLSLLREEGTWIIVQEVSTADDVETMLSSPPGCLIQPAALAADRSSGRDDALGDIRRAAQTYLDANHLSDTALMRTCMDPSTVLFSVDATSGKVQARTADEYFALMSTRAAATEPEVLQYDAQLKVGPTSLLHIYSPHIAPLSDHHLPLSNGHTSRPTPR